MKTKKALITVVAVIAFLLLLTAAPAALPPELASAIADSGTLDTTITIQNSGDVCSSIWIYYKEEGNCEFQVAQHIECLAPGEAIQVGSGPDTDVPFPAAIIPPWLGSVYIAANEPLAIVVNQSDASSTMLLSHAGVPYPDYGDTTNYTSLIHRDFDGWNAEIQVQNLTQESLPTFVCLDFMDQDGDEILFVCDWVCRNGTHTWYLSDIEDLGINHPFGYVGACEIWSLEQVDYPGPRQPPGQPIASVVSLINSDSGEALSYNAFPSQQVTGVTTFALPLIRKPQQGPTSEIVIRNNSDCNQIKGKIWIWDETGNCVGEIDVPWLHPKHLKTIDLAYQGWLPRGFVGAGTFEVLEVVQLCDVDGDGDVDDEPVMPSIVVLDRDDSASGQEAIPIKAASPPTPDPNTRIQVPAIDADDGWETWIHTQNVGDANTGAIILFWGGYSGLCPPNALGPIGYACQFIPQNGVFILKSAIPTEAKSAILYSVSDDLFRAACDAAGSIDSYEAWRNWQDTYAYGGEPLAVTVDRSAYDGSSASGMYNGFSETMLGSGPPFKYFAFPVMHSYSKPPPATVPVDIKPQSCPNPFNTKSKGVLPVAILGTGDFDVTQVDPVSVRLQGVSPLRWDTEDVATPFEPFTGKEDAYDCNEYGPDGYADLTLKFDSQEIVVVLGDVEDGDVLVLQLTGKLQDEHGGTPIVGEDVVVILKKGKK